MIYILWLSWYIYCGIHDLYIVALMIYIVALLAAGQENKLTKRRKEEICVWSAKAALCGLSPNTAAASSMITMLCCLHTFVPWFLVDIQSERVRHLTWSCSLSFIQLLWWFLVYNVKFLLMLTFPYYFLAWYMEDFEMCPVGSTICRICFVQLYNCAICTIVGSTLCRKATRTQMS